MKRLVLQRLGKPAKIKLAIAAGALLLWVAPVPKLGFSHKTAQPSFPVPQLPPSPTPDMSQVTARPLFTQTRRPPPPPPSVPAPATAPAPVATTNGMILLGVLNTGRKSVALVSLAGQSQPVLIGIGATLGVWTVIAIMPDHISLRTGRTTAALSLPAPPNTMPANNSFLSPRNFPGFPSPP